MLFIAILTEKLNSNGADVILVGGQAIDFYTGGVFATSDIDLIVSNRSMAENLLNKFGFEKKANGLWLDRDLNIVVQLISNSYTGDPGKVRKFRVRDLELKVAAPEDLIRNRLYSLKFWQSNPQRDLEESVALLKLFSESLDNAYLDKIAKENDIEDALKEARNIASDV
jgi:hypothetical protein